MAYSHCPHFFVVDTLTKLFISKIKLVCLSLRKLAELLLSLVATAAHDNKLKYFFSFWIDVIVVSLESVLFIVFV